MISTQRVNRAVLPHLRAQNDGLLLWTGSTSTRGGTTPYLGPYFAAKAAMDSLVVSHAADTGVRAAYDAQLPHLMDDVSAKLAELSPPAADPVEVARQIVRVVDLPQGQRPFRVHIDPAQDGAEAVNNLGDQTRRDFYTRIGLTNLLTPP